MLVVDQLAEVLAVNLTEAGLNVPVLYGTHKTALQQGPARIVVGLRPAFTVDPGHGPNFPGPVILPGSVPPRAARIIYSRGQDFAVWVRGEPPGSNVPPADRSRTAQASTATLLHHVLGALWRAGPNVVVAQTGEWLDLDSADFTFGAVVKLNCRIAGVPVRLDERLVIRDARPGETVTELALPGGSVEVAVTTPAAP